MANKVVIIGSGPAGLTAGIYAARAKLNPILIEGNQSGGQLITASKVENWPGRIEIMGVKLMMEMREQAKTCGCELVSDSVIKVDFSSIPYKIFTQGGQAIESESVIIATGASHKKLGIPGEEKYWSKGVSVCATCDAPFFKDKNVVIAGGGNSAMMEAMHLSKLAKKVTIIHLLDELTATDKLKDKILQDPKIKIVFNASLKEIQGDGQKVTQVLYEDLKTQKMVTLPTDGIFVAIGMKPNTEIFKGQIEVDHSGHVVKHNDVQTNKNGIFVAGDVADTKYKQAITASAQGCMAALTCEKYLRTK